jgi:YVTN family beta-propeller protein
MWCAAPAVGYTPLAFLARFPTAETVRFIFWQEVRDGRPIPFAIGNAGTGDINVPPGDPALDAFEAIELAFHAWEHVPGVPIQFDLRRTNANELAFDGENVIFFADLGPAGYGAMTVITYDNTTGQILDTDIHMNDHNTRWLTSPNDADGEPLPCPCEGSDRGPGSPNDIQGIATHEIGHVLGLDHSAVGLREAPTTPTMYPRGIFLVPGDGDRPPNSRYRTLESDDIIGIQNLYPAPGWTTDTGTISGVVHDRSDRPLFGAHVVAKSLTTGVEVGAMSGVMAGPFVAAAYAIHGLPPDAYAVRTEPLDGSAPGFVGKASFGGIAQALIPAKFPSVIDLPVSYHRLAFDPALAAPVPLEPGEDTTVDFRPLATMNPLPTFIRTPVSFLVSGTLNTDVTGLLAAASLLYTIDGAEPIAEALPLGGGAFTVTIPQLDSGSLLDVRIEVKTAEGETFATAPNRMQIGLSCEPIVLLSKTGSGRMAAIDTGTLFEVDETRTSSRSHQKAFPLGQAFHATKNGIYVANFGPDTVTYVPLMSRPLPDGGAASLTRRAGVFSPAAREIALDPGADPWGVALSADDERFVYVTGGGTNTIYKVDTRTDELVAQAPVGTKPKGVAVTPDGAKVYVANVESASLSVLDAVGLAPVATIPLEGKPQYVSVTADGGTAVVTLAAPDDVVFIDVASDTVRGATSTSFSGPAAGLVFLAPWHGTTMLAGKFQTGHRQLALIDIPRQSVSTMDLGPSIHTAGGLAFHPDGGRAYVVNHLVPEIVEFEVATASILRRLTLDFVDVRDLLAIDAGHTLCEATDVYDDGDCVGDACATRCIDTTSTHAEAFACLLRQVVSPAVCSAPLPTKLRRSIERRVTKAVVLASKLETHIAGPAPKRTIQRFRVRLEKVLDRLTRRVTAAAGKRKLRKRISGNCAAAINARVEASRSALPNRS